MLGNKKTYDLVFSLGEACSCTQTLRAAGLQVYSYPLDWLFGSTFVGRCQLLESGLKRLIHKEDLTYAYSERSIQCNAYYNQYNDLTFNHDFLKRLPFDEMYPLVRAKYDRRIRRLNKHLEQAHSILVVYIETPITQHSAVSNEQILQFGSSLLKKLNTLGVPKQYVDLLYLHHKPGPLQEIRLSNHILKIECEYKDTHSDLDYSVKHKFLVSLLKRYKLRLPLRYKLQHMLHQLHISFTLSSTKRKKLREKYHVS